MWRITLYQMRKSVGRLIAAGIAIMLGTGFVAATLIASNALTRATYDAATASLAQSDLVISRSGPSLSWDDLDQIRDLPGIADAAFTDAQWALIGGQNDGRTVPVVPASSEPLATYDVTSGRAPTSEDEIALPKSALTALSLNVGDTIAVTSGWGSTSDDATEPEKTIVGIVTNRNNAHSEYGDIGVLEQTAIRELTSQDEITDLGSIMVVLDPGADEASVTSAIERTFEDVDVVDRDTAARDIMASASGGQDVFTAVILAFAGLALIVAALVISNTFQVLVAQRTHTLALLRCAGASRSQLRRSVLLEGAILGTLSSIAGVIVGAGLVQLALVVLARVQDAIDVPSVISVGVFDVLWPILIGLVVTLLACLVPAREATRVAPLAALAPLSAPTLKKRAGKARAAFAILFALFGSGLLVLGLIAARESVEYGLLFGIAGGAIAFFGIVLGAVFWLPPLARLMGALVSRIGPSSRLAAANALRNPRRTAATSTALLIGVTLVATMSVGAASVRATLANQLDQSFPFDLAATLWDSTEQSDNPGELTDAEDLESLLGAVTRVDGVAAAQPAFTTQSFIGPDRMNNAMQDALIISMDMDEISTVLRGIQGEDEVQPGVIAVSKAAVESIRNETLRLRDGDLIRLGSEPTGPQVKVKIVDSSTNFFMADLSDMNKLWQTSPWLVERTVLARLADSANATEVQRDIQDEYPGSIGVTSPAAERAIWDTVVNTILTVIVGLLAVAVIIAMIGVANTLSLSVLERRRESATLRAVGLSRNQLRRMLAIEGAFIALVGACAGIALGLAFGWIGSTIVLSSFVDTALVVPWRDFALVLVVTLAAGLLASVIPARGAVKTPPVAALATQ